MWLGENSILELPSFSRLHNCSLSSPTKNIRKAVVNFKDGDLRFCGGRTEGLAVLDVCYIYEKEGGWVRTFQLSHARYSSAITPLADGSLWASGGISSSYTFLNSSEVLTNTGDLKFSFYFLRIYNKDGC